MRQPREQFDAFHNDAFWNSLRRVEDLSESCVLPRLGPMLLSRSLQRIMRMIPWRPSASILSNTWFLRSCSSREPAGSRSFKTYGDGRVKVRNSKSLPFGRPMGVGFPFTLKCSRSVGNPSVIWESDGNDSHGGRSYLCGTPTICCGSVCNSVSL